MAGPRQDRVEIGYVARAHGIRGELRIVCHDRDSQVLADVDEVFIDGQKLMVSRARPAGDAWLVAVREVADRSGAEGLRGKVVEVDRAELDLDGQVLLADLVDCEVVLTTGQSWGRVAAIEQGPGQDRLVIHDGDVERLLPIVDAFIVDIDFDGARIVVDPPEGLPETPLTER